MLSARRTASTLMATIVIATLAACSTTAEETGPGPVYDTGAPGSEISDEVEAALGPKMTVKFDITGAVTAKGTATATAPSGGLNPLKTCAEYAKGTNDQRYLAPGEVDASTDGDSISFDMYISGYAGPGTYPKNQLGGSGPSPYVAIDTSIYSILTDSTTSEATTDGKGGGSWTFTNVRNRREGSRPDDVISGTVSWTCQKRVPRSAVSGS